jgi:hypothetical protein
MSNHENNYESISEPNPYNSIESFTAEDPKLVAKRLAGAAASGSSAPNFSDETSFQAWDADGNEIEVIVEGIETEATVPPVNNSTHEPTLDTSTESVPISTHTTVEDVIKPTSDVPPVPTYSKIRDADPSPRAKRESEPVRPKGLMEGYLGHESMIKPAKQIELLKAFWSKAMDPNPKYDYSRMPLHEKRRLEDKEKLPNPADGIDDMPEDLKSKVLEVLFYNPNFKLLISPLCPTDKLPGMIQTVVREVPGESIDPRAGVGLSIFAKSADKTSARGEFQNANGVSSSRRVVNPSPLRVDAVLPPPIVADTSWIKKDLKRKGGAAGRTLKTIATLGIKRHPGPVHQLKDFSRGRNPVPILRPKTFDPDFKASTYETRALVRGDETEPMIGNAAYIDSMIESREAFMDKCGNAWAIAIVDAGEVRIPSTSSLLEASIYASPAASPQAIASYMALRNASGVMPVGDGKTYVSDLRVSEIRSSGEPETGCEVSVSSVIGFAYDPASKKISSGDILSHRIVGNQYIIPPIHSLSEFIDTSRPAPAPEATPPTPREEMDGLADLLDDREAKGLTGDDLTRINVGQIERQLGVSNRTAMETIDRLLAQGLIEERTVMFHSDGLKRNIATTQYHFVI